ncbi:RNA recognition motif 2-domain-containing protein [Dichomitus squalens]|uniref:RNA recognition motif 2-domain-containing protein n=1 Tax=Dichomitus squalens TaxID=114155 RepID=A0A4Q9QBQ2_9APHY|nr:RNA recognition motif 2-domain-containing protein [Dichomitus squalens]
MDLHAVPFPTTHQPEDSLFIDKRPSVPPRLHSTPSLPNLWLPHHYGSLSPSLPLQGSARHRPHLRPLDLASSPSSSPTKKDGPSHLARRPPSLLTPPLTPSSSFNGTSNDTPFTPPDPLSPSRWASSTDRDHTYTLIHPSYSAGSKTYMTTPTTAAHDVGYLTPTSARSQSLSSDDGTGKVQTPSAAQDVSTLATGLASVDITPRDERTCVVVGLDEAPVSDLEIGEATSDKPTRLVLIRNVPSTASATVLREAFSGIGDIKGILARFQYPHGVVILAFYDSRDATRALRQISANQIPTLGDARLSAAFVSPADVERLTGKSEFLAELDGSFFVTVEARSVAPRDVQNLLASFGELASFDGAGTDPHDQTFHVDYHDCRDAASAYKALNNRTIFGARLTLVSNKDVLTHPVRLMQGAARSMQDSELQRDMEGRSRPRSMSVSEGVGTPDAARKLNKTKDISQDHGRRSSNDLFFDAIGKGLDSSHAASLRPRSISASAENFASNVGMQPPGGGYMTPGPAYPYAEPPYGYGHPLQVQVPSMYPAHSYPYPVYGHDVGMYGPEVEGLNWTYTGAHPRQVDYYLPSVPRPPVYAHAQPVASISGTSVRMGQQPLAAGPGDRTTSHTNGHHEPTQTASSNDGFDNSLGGPRAPGAKNVLDIQAIESGIDTRTTVMIKNIPNKMTDRDLKNFIDRVCPRRIDFMYLRMDFQNGCNVGYAFVNFITVQDLLQFAKTQIGVKWNMYSSEKTLQMCYATYQGKESLVEKFKNSCIMDEKEAWRPKIYHSDGPNQGLPEPFPPPTHLRRKERSQHNRGALFVPGTHHQPSGGGGLYHHRPHPPRMSGR